VGYERITGLRLRHQHPDGTFSAGKSGTISVDSGALREMAAQRLRPCGPVPGDTIKVELAVGIYPTDEPGLKRAKRAARRRGPIGG
jgi:hypothetical protein